MEVEWFNPIDFHVFNQLRDMPSIRDYLTYGILHVLSGKDTDKNLVAVELLYLRGLMPSYVNYVY